MGFKASWIAVADGDVGEVLSSLGLVETGEVDFDGRARLACARLANGWVVVRSADFDFASDDRLGAIPGNDVVGFQAWDTVMFSAARGYRNSLRAWSVVHDPDAGRRSLEVTGIPPAEFADVRDGLLKEQAEHEGDGVDYIFDIPLALSAAICGFRADAPCPVLWSEVEPRRSGRGGEKQAAHRRLAGQLRNGVEAEVYPLAAELGFEPISAHPDFYQFYPEGGSNTFIRLRDGLSDGLSVYWGIASDAPRVALGFFVRRGSEPRYGGAGRASTQPRKLSVLERLTGRRGDIEAEIEAATTGARELLRAIDAHVKGAPPDPRLTPAEYFDEVDGPG